MAVTGIFGIALSVLFLVIAVSLFCGNDKLIMDHHQKNVTEENKPRYRLLAGTGMLILAVGLLASGVLCLAGGAPMLKISGVICAVCVASAIVIIVIATKKYNGSIF